MTAGTTVHLVIQRLNACPYFCPICGALNESVQNLMCELEELSDLRFEVFGRGHFYFEWLVRACADECFMGSKVGQDSFISR